ncbi:RNA polymerase sigma-54 factor [Snodgrassella alvi]|uniref:RNA polymerase factor sigma-54 n=1 Tax=Snodgrassella alvi TaxID=1196083 RepID=UPI0009FE20F0|nr:RNA polymerase factor sigma-54 [Snodgrassella alvi]ORF01928.1 RNA polymerase sigma-54 factor [Snodgrassella alvi]ORF06918.1 RNA polymerase sigma-54 factor [Snodgrassella alvi]ORF10226.1 RNA polymerase sigma-54 factor [Snodgrassella alvi]ORF14048.1 RNA polymerase sigma-54 factor [Snodgrassella alvi]ORF19999.1 RNA polymerase sigma-54 factor [Snodgrassella alvi]
MQRPATHLRLSLTTRLSPKLQQSLQVLQLSTLELQELVAGWLADNPFLEEVENTSEDSFSDTQYVQPPQLGIMQDESDVWDTLADNPDMYELLRRQVCEYDLDDVTAAQVYFLIENLNEQGYLDSSLTDLVENAPLEWRLDETELTQALTILQQFEPTGVGARNLQESLLLQLDNLSAESVDNDEIHTCARLLISNHFGQWLSTHQFKQLCRQLPQFSANTLEAACKLIGALNPYPCYGLPDRNGILSVRPDMEVYINKSGHWQIRLLHDTFPQLRIEPGIEEWIEQKSTEMDTMCKNKWQEAQTCLHSLQMRKTTLQRLGEWILQQQQDFFSFGSLALAPLTIKETAQALELAESTVSRAINQKYLTCSQGVFPLRYFFNQSVAATDDGTGNSQTAIKSLLQSIINGEDPQHPYSDTHLVNQLAKQGINLARRTVAKYREDLKIPPAHQRKVQYSNH